MNLESKKDMKKRGIQSPDLADALCLTFCIATPLDIGVIPSWADVRQVKHDYDPLGEIW
jgi:hypothetical protein